MIQDALPERWAMTLKTKMNIAMHIRKSMLPDSGWSHKAR